MARRRLATDHKAPAAEDTGSYNASCFFLISCFPDCLLSYGSPETQNFEDALAHAQSGQPLARFAAEQMSAVRQFSPIAHRVSVVRLLQGPADIDRRRKGLTGIPSARTARLATEIFVLQSPAKVRKISTR
jgi:hypothetical protein